MLVFVSCLLLLAYAHGLQVNTTEGIVEGSKAVDGDYYAFYGIKYAGPVDGANRFKPPVPPQKHTGVFAADNTNIICAQPTSRGLVGVENCLTLNIFTKNVTTPKPVIVFLNSEEYTNTHTQTYSYKSFVDENIVFVTLNHRLSIFGFLCLGVPEAPGNAGLKDVIRGLEWVKDNIANFGGNPNNVVIMGHGSGAAMVDLLTISPRAQNLAHKAIALSGSALAPWAVAYDPVGYARALAAKVGYDHRCNSELAKHLKKTDVNILATELNEFYFKNNTPLFAPCVENLKLKDSVLTDDPINILRSGNYSHMPYIAGYTTREGTLRAHQAAVEQWLESMQVNFSNFLQVDLNFGKNKTAETQRIRQFYFSNSSISMDTIEDFLDYEGDTLIVVSAIRGAKERGLTSNSEVRLLEFGYVGTMNSDWSYSQIPLKGVKHGGILNYLFNYDLKPNDELVMTSIVKRFAGFAYTGNPVAVIGARSSGSWPSLTNNTLNYLFYGGESTVGIKSEVVRFEPHSQRMTFWNDIYSKYYVAPPPFNSAPFIFNCLFVVLFSQLFVKLF